MNGDPVNYNDPSGHIGDFTMDDYNALKKGLEQAWAKEDQQRVGNAYRTLGETAASKGVKVELESFRGSTPDHNVAVAFSALALITNGEYQKGHVLCVDPGTSSNKSTPQGRGGNDTYDDLCKVPDAGKRGAKDGRPDLMLIQREFNDLRQVWEVKPDLPGYNQQAVAEAQGYVDALRLAGKPAQRGSAIRGLPGQDGVPPAFGLLTVRNGDAVSQLGYPANSGSLLYKRVDNNPRKRIPRDKANGARSYIKLLLGIDQGACQEMICVPDMKGDYAPESQPVTPPAPEPIPVVPN